jgi:AcrR family transcriptional regulator
MIVCTIMDKSMNMTASRAHSVADDRRVVRNRGAILKAMVELVGEKRWAEITVNDIVGRADVARSTFYKHFCSKEDVLLASMQPMLRILARRGDTLSWRADLDRLLGHYWASRSLARAVFGGERASVVERKLREESLKNIGSDESVAVRQMIAIRMAAGRIAIIREWVKGEFSAKPHKVANAIADCT